MKYYILIALLPFLARGQECVSKALISDETGNPIYNAHIYIRNQSNIGTITNEDGIFILCGLEEESRITISHVGFLTKEITFNSIEGETIELHPKVLQLGEVEITDLSGIGMMNSVIDSLYVNHYVEPILYTVFVRVAEHESDQSYLHLFSEFLINLQINEKSKHRYKVMKFRARPFSMAGQKYFKDDMRIMHGIGGASQHIFGLGGVRDYFKKKKLKNFDISLLEIPSNNDLVGIKLASLKEDLTVTLVIEKKTYAITKILRNGRKKKWGSHNSEVGFKKTGSKWILDYAIRNHSIDYLFDKYLGKNREVETMRTLKIIFNINENEIATPDYKSYINIVAEPIKYHIGSWTDDFWETNIFIPIPRWIKEKMSESALTRAKNP